MREHKRKHWFLKIVIFAILWIVGGYFFASFGGSVGTFGGMLYIGKSVLGSSLATDGSGLVNMIFSFIITAVIYYIVATIITFLLMKLFARK